MLGENEPHCEFYSSRRSLRTLARYCGCTGVCMGQISDIAGLGARRQMVAGHVILNGGSDHSLALSVRMPLTAGRSAEDGVHPRVRCAQFVSLEHLKRRNIADTCRSRGPSQDRIELLGHLIHKYDICRAHEFRAMPNGGKGITRRELRVPDRHNMGRWHRSLAQAVTGLARSRHETHKTWGATHVSNFPARSTNNWERHGSPVY